VHPLWAEKQPNRPIAYHTVSSDNEKKVDFRSDGDVPLGV
jgi:hypothetical protein